jgi:hypothetical protein
MGRNHSKASALRRPQKKIRCRDRRTGRGHLTTMSVATDMVRLPIVRRFGRWGTAMLPHRDCVRYVEQAEVGSPTLTALLANPQSNAGNCCGSISCGSIIGGFAIAGFVRFTSKNRIAGYMADEWGSATINVERL